jgi:diguanylate cyclase (GGDEF)-like protein
MGANGEQDIDALFWERYARTAQVLNLFIVLIDLAYVFATWGTGSNRPALAALNIAALAGIVAGTASRPELKIARSSKRDLIFGAWCLSGIVLIAFAVQLDGGLSSPLAWLLPLSVMFTAMVHRPKLVVLSGLAALVTFLILGALDDTAASAGTRLALRSAYLVALTYAAAVTSRVRWSHYDSQVSLRQALSSLADHDGLTGLLNHRSFHDLLEQHLSSSRSKGEPVALLLVDLDHFKEINDSHGHLVGDEVLQAVTAAITGAIRTGDHAGRVGGEEFCILLPGAGADDARAVAERVRETVEAIAGPASVTTSIGLSAGKAGETSARELLDRADGALYEAKRTGRNKVCWLKAA